MQQKLEIQNKVLDYTSLFTPLHNPGLGLIPVRDTDPLILHINKQTNKNKLGC